MFRKLALLAAIATVSCGKTEVPSSDEELSGSWVVVSSEAFGKPVPVAPGTGMKLSFHKDKATWRFQTDDGWRAFDGTLRFDPNANPKTIELGEPDKPAGAVAYGIYTFRDGRLIISMGEPRPRTFDEPSDAKLILKRD